MYDSTYAVCTENGAETRKTDSLYGPAEPGRTALSSERRVTERTGTEVTEETGTDNTVATEFTGGTEKRSTGLDVIRSECQKFCVRRVC